MILKSPAKLNLYLNVLRKRPDGYHDIETIFEKIALFDIITIKPGKNGIRITTNNPALPTGRDNLAYKAAGALFNKAGFRGAVWIDIRKNIPIAAGLGGGSSNAATVLLGINKLFKFGFSRKELIEIGKTLGADVPFFIYDYNYALGRGRGDDITPIISHNIDTNIWHILILFPFGVSTKTVYRQLNLRLTPARLDVKMLLPFVLNKDIENLGVSLYNKLEEVTLKKKKVAAIARDLLLKEGAYGAVVSGSGPTIFGITKTREEAVGVRNRIRKVLKNGCNVLVAKTFN